MEYYNYFIIFDNFAVKEVQIYFVKLWFSNFDFFKLCYHYFICYLKTINGAQIDLLDAA